MTEQTKQATATNITLDELDGMVEIAYDNWRTLSIGQRLMVQQVAAKLDRSKQAAMVAQWHERQPAEATTETGEKINQEEEPSPEDATPTDTAAN